MSQRRAPSPPPADTVEAAELGRRLGAACLPGDEAVPWRDLHLSARRQCIRPDRFTYPGWGAGLRQLCSSSIASQCEEKEVGSVSPNAAAQLTAASTPTPPPGPHQQAAPQLASLSEVSEVPDWLSSLNLSNFLLSLWKHQSEATPQRRLAAPAPQIRPRWTDRGGARDKLRPFVPCRWRRTPLLWPPVDSAATSPSI